METRTYEQFNDNYGNSSLFFEVVAECADSGAPMADVREAWVKAGYSLVSILSFAEKENRAPSPFGEDDEHMNKIEEEMNGKTIINAPARRHTFTKA